MSQGKLASRSPPRQPEQGENGGASSRRNGAALSRIRMLQPDAQGARFDFEVTVGLQFAVTARTHMMQHEDRPDARENQPQRMMRAGPMQ